MIGLIWFVAGLSVIVWLIRQPRESKPDPIGTVTFVECAQPRLRDNFEVAPIGRRPRNLVFTEKIKS